MSLLPTVYLTIRDRNGIMWYMVQPIIHNLVHWKQDGNDHTMWYTLATSVGPHGMVQPIAVTMT